MNPLFRTRLPPGGAAARARARGGDDDGGDESRGDAEGAGGTHAARA